MEGQTDYHSGRATADRNVDSAGSDLEGFSDMSPNELDSFMQKFAEMKQSYDAQNAELTRLRAELQAARSCIGKTSDYLPVAYLALDAEHHIVAANQKAAHLLGIMPAALRGRDLAEFVSSSSNAEFHKHLREIMEHRGARVCQLHLVRSDGTHFYAQMNSRLIPHKISRGACIWTVLTDVTEHRQAVEAFGRLAAIVESSDDAIIGKDLDNRITSWNAGAQRIYGWTAEEVIGSPISILLPPENVDGVITLLEDLKQGRQIDHHVSVHVARDGRLIDVSLAISPIRDADGKITGASTIARDITDRRKAAEALRASETNLRTILDAFPDAILQVDRELKVLWANRMATDLGAEIAGDCCDLYGRPCQADCRCAALKAIEEGKTVTSTFCLLGDDGKEKCWENVGVPLLDSDGQIKGALLIARDVTRRTLAERAMLEYQEKLRKQGSELVLAEERQRRRMAVALHDNIIQDLAISMLRVEILKEKANSLDRPLLEEFAQTLTKIIDETRSMTFDISSPTLYRLGLAAAVDELLDDFLHCKHGIHYEFHVDEETMPLDEDVRVLMYQSVRELLVNVVKHSQADQVCVCIERCDRMMQLTVSDNGKGFDVGRTEPAMHRPGGFGLFNIRERLDYIGGRMEVYSEKDRGSRFVLYAPLKN